MAPFALAACGNTCVSGIFNNGSGVVIVKSANPPPACPFGTGMGMMNVVILKARTCEACTPSIQTEHIFVTLKGIELRSASLDSPNTPEWIHLAPQLLLEPRHLDLLGDSTPERLVQSVLIPAGIYHEVRLQFLSDAATSPDAPPTEEDSCGQNHGNCMVMADGHTEQFYFVSDSPELLLPVQMNGSRSLAVVPGSVIDLRLMLRPQQFSSVSPSGAWQLRFTLVGNAFVSR